LRDKKNWRVVYGRWEHRGERICWVLTIEECVFWRVKGEEKASGVPLRGREWIGGYEGLRRGVESFLGGAEGECRRTR